MVDERIERLLALAGERILILDGAMGTALQSLKLEEADYRGDRLAAHNSDLKGNQDILNLTRPDVIANVHREYFRAGADIVETNTFNSTSISQAEYGTGDLAYEISFEGARLARQVADLIGAEEDRPLFVAGAMGPTNKTLSVSPDIDNPAYRAVEFEEVASAYKTAARGLIEGGADFILIETIFDTLNAKAAVAGVMDLADEIGQVVPIILSLTVTDLSGRTLSGQTVEGFWNSIRHAKPLAVGLNCAFGAQDLRPYIRELSRIADVPIIAYPNAGLPNELGDYTETPDVTAGELGEWAKAGFLNIVGGCCGTTPAHISAIRDAALKHGPRHVPDPTPSLRLAGLEALTVQT